jgi:large subunit ribosomal protein L31
MKTEIHPKYNEVEISCACGAVLQSRSTQAEIRLDICAACHPFFTGTQKIVDTEGRVERFKKKYDKK